MHRINRRWWAVTQACVITLLFMGCDSTGPETPETPETPVAGLRLEAYSDTALTGTVGSRIAAIPVVRLTLDGKPAPGREIRFAASGGGSIEVAIQRTDTAGLASPGTWTLGTTAKPQTLTARSTGAADFVFTVVPKAESPASVNIVAGNHQTAAVGAALAIPLQVRLTDQYGNPVPNAPVTYTVTMGAGTLLGASTRTDSLGFASSGTWTLRVAGPQLVRILVAGQPVYFDAFACGDPCRGRDLLFTSGNELFSLVDGTTTRLFATDASAGTVEAWLSSAAWSPDGQRIAFTVNHYDWALDTSHVALYLMDADGSNAVLREDGFSDPSWSPDGHQLAARGPAGVYVMSAESNGTPPVLLATGAFDPAWSPEGTQIAFADIVSGMESGVVGSLKVMQADGTAVTTIVSDALGGIGAPTWSPDGARLAYTECDAFTCGRLFIVGADGGDPVEVGPGMNATDPAWSPDGSRIGFRPFSSSQGGIVWVPADGSFTTPLPLVDVASGFAWRP